MDTQLRGSQRGKVDHEDRRRSLPAKERDVASGRLGHILARSRWDGVLSSDELELCRAHGISLAYDCAQIGWVPEACVDETDLASRPHVGRRDDSGPRLSAGDPVSRVRRRFRRQVEDRLASVAEGSRDRVVQELRAEGRAQAEALADSHGVHLADRAHWALRVTLHRALSESRTGATPVAARDPEGFSFRPWTADDVPVYLELLRNPAVWEFLPEPYPRPFTESTARTFIEVGAFDFHHEAVAVELEGVPVGQCLLRFDSEAGGVRAAEVAYWLGEDHWGKGYMSRILPLFTRRSFREHRPDVIYAWIREDHEASARVARRAGYHRDDFPLEGSLAESLGRPRFVRYATFAEDWRV